MSPKVKRNNGARSYSPRNNWKSSSRWIGLTSVSWWRPSKKEHPRMRGSNQPNPGTSMVPMTERLWTLGLQKWRIIYMPPRFDGTRPKSLPNPTWKAMPPRGGGQWNKRKGRTMATLGSSSRNALRPNLSQGTPTTSRGANFVTLWMPQMKIWDNMWGLTRANAWHPAYEWAGSCVPIRDGTSNLGQAKAWGESALLTIRSHHKSGRLLGCGTGWKIRIQEGQQVPS